MIKKWELKVFVSVNGNLTVPFFVCVVVFILQPFLILSVFSSTMFA